MARINVGRVILGGLAAGVVINVVEVVMNMAVLADMQKPMMERIGAAEPSGGALAGLIVLGFVLGTLVAWTYAAIRPRYGMGPGTAVCAGIAVWVAATFVPTMSWHLVGLFGPGLAGIGLAYGLVEMVLAALVAGMVYKEDAVPRAA